MRTLPTNLSGVIVALTVLASVPSAARVRAAEHDAKLRREALKVNDITGKDPVLGEEITLIKNKAHAKKLVAEAARMAGETPQPFDYNATYILGRTARRVKNFQAAETFYRLHLDQAKHLRSLKGFMAAYEGLIACAYGRRKYAETEKLCKEAGDNPMLILVLRKIQIDKDIPVDKEALATFLFALFEDQALAIAQQGEVKRAIEFIDNRYGGEQSESLLILDLKGKIYRLAGKNKEALKVFEDEIEQIKGNNDLKKKQQEALLDDIRYSMSGVYIELDDVDKAAEELKALLAKYPNNATYNNDLGYVWADHDRNLVEAEKMIRKALAEDRKQKQKDDPELKPEQIKDNGSYLDSLGWVLFKQKKYVEAKRYLRQAVQNIIDEGEGESIEIYDHLGEVLMALGQKTEAVATWKKGVQVAGESKREQKRKDEVQKKIKANE